VGCTILKLTNSLNSAVFQAGGLVVVLVEVNRKAYLASVVPVIVNAILSEHQIIVDIVAFVSKGDFPRSRLGEKQRGKILAGWVTRKMRTLAQFAIRDLDQSAMGDGPSDSAEMNRMSTSSVRSSAILGAGASSLRNVEYAGQIPEHGEYNPHQDMTDPRTHSILADDQPTPTGMPPRGPMGAPDDLSLYDDRTSTGVSGYGFDGYEARNEAVILSELDSTPVVGYDNEQQKMSSRLPGVDGREHYGVPEETHPDAEEWTADAMMHMNLASSMDKRRDAYD
jgi:hypothetical protein